MSLVIARNWPPASDQIAYLSSLPKDGFAWEFLRRNEGYQHATLVQGREIEKTAEIGTGIPVFRLACQDRAAEAWSLYSFRRSSPDC